MKSNPDWTQHFQIPADMIANWEKHQLGKKTLALWCLEQGAIEGHAYLSWARDNFELPSIGTQFFQQEPNIQFWQQIQGVANWTEELIPIAEWNGVVFVACVQPQMDIQWSFPVRYVLAHPIDLKNYWQALHTENPIENPTENPSEEANKWEAQLADWANKTEAAPVAPVDAPEGISFSAVATPPSTSGLALDPMEELRRQMGLNDDSSAEAQPVTAEAPPEVPELDMPEGMEVELEKPIVAPPPVVQMAPPMVSEHTAEHTTVTQVTNVHTGFLSEFHVHFKSGMILEIENETYVPVVWDEGFKIPDPNAVKRFSLNEPSGFRVAFRTKMPYIGHIVDTPQNQEFFKLFGFEELPQAALIQPVMQNKKVTYLLLALYDPGRKTHHVSSGAESLVQKFLARIESKSSAAA